MAFRCLLEKTIKTGFNLNAVKPKLGFWSVTFGSHNLKSGHWYPVARNPLPEVKFAQHRHVDSKQFNIPRTHALALTRPAVAKPPPLAVGQYHQRQSQGSSLWTARYATSSANTSASGELFSWLTGEQSRSLSSLDTPLATVSIPPPLPDYAEPGKTKITTLPNGIRIASETLPNPIASIGLYVDCGSIYETPISSGATFLLERMAFKSTKNRTHYRIMKEVEAIGGHVTASASREQMVYTYEAIKTNLPEMVELLIDCVRNPVFLDREVDEELKRVRQELEELHNDPQCLLAEAIHVFGFSGALSNPLLAPESALNRLNGAILEQFVSENYTAPRMVLAASGVEHEELLSLAEPLLSDLPSVPRPEYPESVYVGGQYRHEADSGDTHFILAFEVPGVLQNEKDAASLMILQMLLSGMGGSGYLPAAFPVKRVPSRLSRFSFPDKFQHQIQSFYAFISLFCKTGIFGIHATTDSASEHVDAAVWRTMAEMCRLGTPGEVDRVILRNAKEATKSSILMNLETRKIASADLGRQILTYGQRKPPEHFLKAVDEITCKDIVDTAQKVMCSPPTIVSYGNVSKVPSIENFNSFFSLE